MTIGHVRTEKRRQLAQLKTRHPTLPHQGILYLTLHLSLAHRLNSGSMHFLEVQTWSYSRCTSVNKIRLNPFWPIRLVGNDENDR